MTFINITFLELLQTALYLAVGYGILWVLESLNTGVGSNNPRLERLQNAISVIRRFYLPIAIIILLVMMIFWQREWVGIPSLLLGILFFKPIRQFFMGRLLRAKPELQPGSILRVHNDEGRIIKNGVTSIELSIKDGIKHIPYDQLYQCGYTAIRRSASTATITKKLSPSENNTHSQLVDLLAGSPYIDHLDAVEAKLNEDQQIITVRYTPKSESYQSDIESLITKLGFHEVF